MVQYCKNLGANPLFEIVYMDLVEQYIKELPALKVDVTQRALTIWGKTLMFKFFMAMMYGEYDPLEVEFMLAKYVSVGSFEATNIPTLSAPRT